MALKNMYSAETEKTAQTMFRSDAAPWDSSRC